MTRIEETYPLSPLQQGMLFNTLYSPESGIDIEQVICVMNEEIDVSLFRNAWGAVVLRYPTLRTVFRWENLDQPVQDVLEEAEIEFEFRDIHLLDSDGQVSSIDEYIEEDRDRGFDLRRGPLTRIALFRLSPGRFQMVWTWHHLILDAPSLAPILEDLFSIYRSLTGGEPAGLNEVVPYRKFVDWLGSTDQSGSEGYWRELLSGFHGTNPAVVSSDHLEGERTGFGSQRKYFSVELIERISDASKSLGVTPYTFFAGAYAIILSRYGRGKDIVFGAVRGGRRFAFDGAEAMVGLCLNTLPLRSSFTEGLTVEDYLRSLRRQHLETGRFMHAQLAEIQKWSGLKHGMPLFEAILNFQYRPWDALLKSKGGKWEGMEFDILHKTTYPLSIDVRVEPDPVIVIDYDRSRFSDGVVASMSDHFLVLLEGMAADPSQLVLSVPMLTEQEREQIVVEFNRTESETDEKETVVSLFERQAKKIPDAVAVKFGEDDLAYGVLFDKVCELAGKLLDSGLKGNEPVGICVDRSLEMIVGILGIMKAGAAYVPIDPDLPYDRRKYIMEDSGARFILTKRDMAGEFGDKTLTVICIEDLEGQVPECDRKASGPEPDDLAYIIYTSGSTGRPKGVMIEHRQLSNYLSGVWSRMKLGEGRSYATVSTISADLGNTVVYSSLVSGGCLHVISYEMLSDPDSLARYFSDNEIECLKIVPSHMAALLTAEDPARTLPKRLLILGGEESRLELIEKIRSLAPDLTVMNHYGPTEATVGVLTYRLEPGSAMPCTPTLPVGRPIDNTKVYILDEGMNPLPAGVPGELYIGGKSLARGYFGNPSLTSERFIRDPFSEDKKAKLYRTGDLVKYLDDGNIEFLGRVDFQVKISGYRIELEEIESVLRMMPGVRDCLVLAHEARPGMKKLAAYYMPEKEGSPGEDGLKEWLKSRLPDYMVPAVYIEIDTIPLTLNGKVDRDALPSPDFSGSDDRDSYREPRNQTESVLVAIWQKILGVGKIGTEDNFFDLGGHSLLAIRLFTEIKKELGASVPLAAIFQSPTIRQLAVTVAEQDWSQSGRSLVSIRTTGSKPPLFCVHAYGGGVFFYRELADHLGPDQPFYALQAMGMDGKRPAYTLVEEMAGRYISEMKEMRPHGPYYLGGRCLGAYIALEMAHQLREEGEDVRMLAILDSYWTPAMASGPGSSLRYHLDNLRRLGLLMKVIYLLTNVKERFEKIYDRFRLLACNINFRLGRPLPPALKEFYVDVQIPKINKRAEWIYKPPKYGGKITFFQATAETARDPRSFWGKHTTQELDVYMVKATHRDILVEPNVREMAEKLEMALKAAREKGDD